MNNLNQLDHLHEIADRALFCLKADDKLKQKIIQTAASASEKSSSLHFYQMIPGLISLSLVMVLLFFIAGSIPTATTTAEPRIISISAGSPQNSVADLKISQDLYFVLQDPADNISLLDKIGEVNQSDIVSKIFPAGSEVFRTDTDQTIAVVTKDGVSFLRKESVP